MCTHNRPLPDIRIRLLAATHGCVACDGFHATTTQNIALWAGVGHGTLFRYFPTKKALFLAAFDHATALLSGSEAPDPPELTLHELFHALWLRTARHAAQHAHAFAYWRLFRATPLDRDWDPPKALQLGPFRRVPHLILEAVGTTRYREYDAWLMASQWSAAVQFIMAVFPRNPVTPPDPREGPTPLHALERAYEAWWAGIGLLRDTPAIYQRREEQ